MRIAHVGIGSSIIGLGGSFAHCPR
jgi:hypothetical protein